MSLRSMTGYGYGEATGNDIRISVELSTVNRKQLDLQIQVSRSLVSFEPAIISRLQQEISRGRLTGQINISHVGPSRNSSVTINEDLAEAYLTKLRQAAKRLKIKDEFNLAMLLDLPEVVTCAPPHLDPKRTWVLINQALTHALKALIEMRDNEGRALKKHLDAHLRRLQQELGRIKKYAPKVCEHYRKLLCERLHAAKVCTDDPDGRLMREVAYYADKADIAEELARLDSHFQQVDKAMHSDEPAGRSLDFIAQELLREINTIGSKANDRHIATAVIHFKAELERFREQIQNIE